MIALVCLCVTIYGRRRCRKEEISGRAGGERYKVEVEVAVAVAVALGLLLSPGSSFVRGSSAAGRNHIADAKNMSFFRIRTSR